MLPTKFPPTYFQQSSAAEIRPIVSPLERAEPKHEPGTVIYHLTGRQFVPIVGSAPYNPALMDWLRRDEYMPFPNPNLTYLYASGSTII